MHRAARALTVGWVVGFWEVAAGAASLPSLGAAELVRRAETIVVGTVAEVQVAPTKDHSAAFTYVTVEVAETLKGSVGEKLVTLEFLGGLVDDHELVLAGRPEFLVGEKYVFFVARNGRAGCPVLGWSQGLLRVVPHPSGKGETLTDHDGRPLLRLTGGDWQRGPGRIDLAGRVFATPGAAPRVVSEQGIRIGAPEVAASLPPSPPAEVLLRGLASLVTAEARQPGFIAGRELVSFDVTDVPETYPPARWSAARP